MNNLNDFLNLEKNVSNRKKEFNFNFENADEVKSYVETLVSNPDSKDPFWDDMAKNLLLSVIFLQLTTLPEEKQNLYTSAEIITESINTIEGECHLAKLIEPLPINHIASMYYKTISIMPPKTSKSIFEHTKEIIFKALENSDKNEENQSSNN